MSNIKIYIGWGFIKDDNYGDEESWETDALYRDLMLNGIFWDITNRLLEIPKLSETLESNYIYPTANDITIKADNHDKFFERIFTPLYSPEGYDKYSLITDYFGTGHEIARDKFRRKIIDGTIKQYWLLNIYYKDTEIYRGVIPYEIDFEISNQRTVSFTAYNLLKWLQMRNGSVQTREEEWRCVIETSWREFDVDVIYPDDLKMCVFEFRGNAGTSPPDLTANKNKVYIYWNNKYYPDYFGWETNPYVSTYLELRHIYSHRPPYETIGYDVHGKATIHVPYGEACPKTSEKLVLAYISPKDSTLEYIRTAILANLTLPQPSHKWFSFRQNVSDSLSILEWTYRLPVNWQDKTIYDMLVELCKIGGGRFFISYADSGYTYINIVNRNYSVNTHQINTAWVLNDIIKEYLNHGKGAVNFGDSFDLGDIIKLQDDEPHPDSIDKYIYYNGHWRKLKDIYNEYFDKPFIKFKLSLPYYDYIDKTGKDIFVGDSVYINGKYAGIVIRTDKDFEDNIIDIETETQRQEDIYDE